MEIYYLQSLQRQQQSSTAAAAEQQPQNKSSNKNERSNNIRSATKLQLQLSGAGEGKVLTACLCSEGGGECSDSGGVRYFWNDCCSCLRRCCAVRQAATGNGNCVARRP